MSAHDIIVIAASAGGVEALRTLVSGLPVDLKASLFIVIHLPASFPSQLPAILSRSGPLPAVRAAENMKIEHGKIYVAPPGFHLMINIGYLHLDDGPKEHHVKPAANPLFRSAARSYGPRVVGVVLTGANSDGADGLLVIKRHGGIAVVQDPQDALFPSMPRSALAHNQIDAIVPLLDMAHVLTSTVESSLGVE